MLCSTYTPVLTLKPFLLVLTTILQTTVPWPRKLYLVLGVLYTLKHLYGGAYCFLDDCSLAQKTLPGFGCIVNTKTSLWWCGFNIIRKVVWSKNSLQNRTRLNIRARLNVHASNGILLPCQLMFNLIKSSRMFNLIKSYFVWNAYEANSAGRQAAGLTLVIA